MKRCYASFLTVRQLIEALSKVEDKDALVWLTCPDTTDSETAPDAHDTPLYRIYTTPNRLHLSGDCPAEPNAQHVVESPLADYTAYRKAITAKCRTCTHLYPYSTVSNAVLCDKHIVDNAEIATCTHYNPIA